tara:strand:- start:832 stop:1071 length:240 start_codon:yes stop_codon:yes gene_type:complete
MSDYNIFEFVIKDSNIYPNGMTIYIANDKDRSSIIKDNRDEDIYFYVDDDINLNNVFIGDTLILDENFIVIGGADAKKD